MESPKKISKRNARGVVVLLGIIFIITILPRIYSKLQSGKPILVSYEEIDKHISDIELKQYTSFSKQYTKNKKKYKSPPTKFDPNTYKMEDWMALGLSEKQANVVVRFAQRGIYNNDYLKQIFVIDERLFNLIKDSTFYPKRLNSNQEKISYQKKEFEKIELNSATAEELDKLPGIGEYFAKNIIDYRNKLGGFINKEQLLEIYHFDSERLTKISDKIEIDRENIKRININTCTVDELKVHPYIGWNIANSIVKMRAKYKNYTNFDQLLESELISVELLERLLPYLTLNN